MEAWERHPSPGSGGFIAAILAGVCRCCCPESFRAHEYFIKAITDAFMESPRPPPTTVLIIITTISCRIIAAGCDGRRKRRNGGLLGISKHARCHRKTEAGFQVVLECLISRFGSFSSLLMHGEEKHSTCLVNAAALTFLCGGGNVNVADSRIERIHP